MRKQDGAKQKHRLICQSHLLYVAVDHRSTMPSVPHLPASAEHVSTTKRVAHTTVCATSHSEIRAFRSRSQFVPLLGSGPRGDQDALNACRGKENANRWVNMPSLKPVPIISPGSSWKFNCLRCVITWNTSIRIFIYTKKMTNSNLYFPHYETLVWRWEDNG
jgi:hypothetical protein